MFRVYEDNDVIKLFGDVSDKGYTNGTRLDYYYVKAKEPTFFVDRWLPKLGKTAVNTYGWSLMQTMYTPENMATTEPDIDDWPYTGALFITHSLHSSNLEHSLNLQTEVVAGVMGKASQAEGLQKFIHHITHDRQPEGWGKQYPTDILLNLNVSMEKQLFYAAIADITGGAEAQVGTMTDGASLFGQIRIGKKAPYFMGLLPQYTASHRNKLRCYLVVRPVLEWIAYNAVLDGGIINGKSDYYSDRLQRAAINHSISRRLDLAAVLGYGNISLSFTQRIMPQVLDGFGHQRLGNISLYVGW